MSRSPPRSRKRNNSASDSAGFDNSSTRKRKYGEPDVNSLINEIESLKTVCNKTFSTVEELKDLILKILDENTLMKSELVMLNSLHATTTAAVSDKSYINNIVNPLQKITSLSTTSYASVVKSNPVVVIKPKNVNQPSEATKKDLRENMSPTASKFCGVRNVANGGIVIECESDAGSNVLLKDATTKLGDNYVVTIPTKRPTKIRILGMSEQLSSEKIIEKIVAQNPEVFHSGYTAEVVSTFKIKERFGAKLIVDSDSFARMITNSKLRLGWDICRVFEAFDLVRCYNCSGYHHLAKNCTTKKQCPKCAGEHTLLECQSTVERCCNCIKAASSLNLVLSTDHSALSSECLVYNRKINAQRRRTNYNN